MFLHTFKEFRLLPSLDATIFNMWPLSCLWNRQREQRINKRDGTSKVGKSEECVIREAKVEKCIKSEGVINCAREGEERVDYWNN